MPLFYASHEGRVEEVRQLLGGGASPDAGYQGTPAVVAASLGGHEAMVGLLIDAAATQIEL